MKQRWLKLAARIDAMAPRERAMAFLGAALVVLAALYALLLDPLYTRQARLKAQIAQEQNQTEGIARETAERLAQLTADPDEPLRARMTALERQIDERRAALNKMQNALVVPNKMAGLLENILKRNAALKLVSLRTLPVSELGAVADGKPDAPAAPRHDAMAAMEKEMQDHNRAEQQQLARAGSLIRASAPAEAPAAAVQTATAVQTAAAAQVAAPTTTGVYRHGVELVVEGTYPDMINYLAALETLPSQIFWGKAQLRVGQYPRATLSLTLYTVSLDPKWLNL